MIRKFIIASIFLLLWAVFVFWWLHFTAAITRNIFWSGWFFTLIASLLFSLIGLGILWKSHKFLALFVQRQRHWAGFVLSLGTLLGIAYALSFLGGFTNNYSWDDKEFLLYSLWFASPVKTGIVSIPFFLLTLAISYFGLVALWLIRNNPENQSPNT